MSNHRYYKTAARIFCYDPDFPMRVHFRLQDTTDSHQHEFCECLYVVGGTGMHQSENHAPIPIRRGDIIVIPRGGHHAYTQVEGLEIINLMFDTSLLPPIQETEEELDDAMRVVQAYFDPGEDAPFIYFDADLYTAIEINDDYVCHTFMKANAKGIPMVGVMYMEGMVHCLYPQYSEIIWDFCKHYSRNQETLEIEYNPYVR